MATNSIKLGDRQSVYLTDKARSVKDGLRKTGDEVQLHPKQAEDWIKSGKATSNKTTKATK